MDIKSHLMQDEVERQLDEVEEELGGRRRRRSSRRRSRSRRSSRRRGRGRGNSHEALTAAFVPFGFIEVLANNMRRGRR